MSVPFERLRILEAQFRQLQADVRSLLRSPRHGGSVRDPIPGDPGVPMRIVELVDTSVYPDRVRVAKCVRTDGQDDGLEQREVILRSGAGVGDLVFVIRTRPYIEDTDAAYRLVEVPEAAAVPVRVESDGGAGGSDGVAATWTYSIFSLKDTARAHAIATEVEVISRLLPIALAVAPAGSIAMAVYDAGTWKIVSGSIAETVAAVEPCEGEE